MAIYSVTVSPRGEGAPLKAADSSRIPPELQVAFASSPQPLRAVREDIYFLRVPDGVSASQVETFAAEFLAGSPRSVADCRPGAALPECVGEATLRIQRKPGVMDSVEQSVKHAMVDAGFAEGCGVRTARRYRIAGWSQSAERLEALATDWLANPIVDDVFAALPGQEAAPADPFRAFPAQPGEAVTVPLRDADDDRLTAISNDGGLSLALEEMRTIRGYFDELGRDPTDVELETLAQTWSEHCCHKTLTGSIEYGDERIGNLLKETIFAVTQELDAPFCWSVFRDNAGVIALDDEWGLSFKVETHNHPSALEPYGGAGTGIGGVLRDTLGTGLGAYPVLSTDVFCFGPLDTPAEELPRGTLSPQRLLTGVVAGVRDYGNRMGIPTANGAILFHPGYIGNPLVFCGSVGLIPRDAVDKTVNPGDLIVAMGGRTGRDGIHGATFSSRELTEESETISAGAVQIGNPIEERKLLDALMRARDERRSSTRG